MPCNNQLDAAIAKAMQENRERREQFARSKYHR